MTHEILDAATCRSARDALCWSPWTLARAAGVAEGFVRDFEAGSTLHRPGMQIALRRALLEGARTIGEPTL
jgi:hypothetical protein